MADHTSTSTALPEHAVNESSVTGDSVLHDRSATTFGDGTAEVLDLAEIRRGRRIEALTHLYPGNSNLSVFIRQMSDTAETLWESAQDMVVIRDDGCCCRRALAELLATLPLADEIGPGALIMTNALLSVVENWLTCELPEPRQMRQGSLYARQIANAPLTPPSQASRTARELREKGLNTVMPGAAELADQLLEGTVSKDNRAVGHD